MQGRIVFPGNPWPNGHAIRTLNWGAELIPNRGLCLALTLTSDDYYAENDGGVEDDESAPSDWQSPGCWSNYHRCTIQNSETSDAPGVLLSDGTAPFDLTAPEYFFHADALPRTVSDVFTEGAFNIYLLGHDACADHRITLKRSDRGDGYDLDWTGKIALAYAGQETWDYEFHAQATGVHFDGISLSYFRPDFAKRHFGIVVDPSAPVQDLIAPYVTNPDAFVGETRGATRYAVLK